MPGRTLLILALASSGLGLYHGTQHSAVALAPEGTLSKREVRITPGEQKLINRITTDPIKRKEFGPEPEPHVPYFAKGKSTQELEQMRDKLHEAHAKAGQTAEKHGSGSRDGALRAAVGFHNDEATIAALKRTPNSLSFAANIPWWEREKLTEGPRARFTDKLRYTPAEVEKSQRLEQLRRNPDNDAFKWIGSAVAGIHTAEYDRELHRMGIKPELKPLTSAEKPRFDPYRTTADRPDANRHPKDIPSLTQHWRQKQNYQRDGRDPPLKKLVSPWDVKKRHRDYYEGGAMDARREQPEKYKFHEANPRGVWQPHEVNWAHGRQKMLGKNWSFQQFELDSGRHKKLTPADNPQKTREQAVNKGVLQRGQSMSYSGEVSGIPPSFWWPLSFRCPRAGRMLTGRDG